MFSRSFIGRIFFLFSLSFSVSAESDALNALVEQLQKIQSISGDFLQFVEDPKGARAQGSKGSFKAKRPGFFYWRTESPLEQTIYSDGITVTVYDPDLEQATVQVADSRTDNTPAVLFSGNTKKIGALYKVDFLSQKDPVSEYILRPRTKDSLFDTMTLKFKGAQISDMRLTDSLGQKSVISFVQTQINPVLDESDFKPNLPEGTDVIEDVPISSFEP